MAFTDKPKFISLLIIFSTFILFASALDLSNVPTEAPVEASGPNGFLPLAEKHVVIRNRVSNRQTLNAHCRSSEDDFGMIRIPWNGEWSFRFHVNMTKSTKFRCHFTWYKGGSHYFYIFKASRDDSAFGQIPVCKECIWDIGRDIDHPACRIPRDGSDPYCFKWEDGP